MQANSAVDADFPYPKRYYRVAIGIFFFYQGFNFASWAARIPDFKTLFSLSEAQLGSLLFAFPLGQFLAVPLIGYCIERFGSRRCLLTAAFLYPFTLTLLGAIPYFSSHCMQASVPAWAVWAFAVVLFFLGFVANMHNLAVNTQAVGVEKLYGRIIMSAFHGLWSLAGFAAGLVGSFLATRSVQPFFHYAGILAVGIFLILILRRFMVRKDISAADTGSNRASDANPAADTDANPATDTDSKTAEKPTFNVFKGMDAFVWLLGFLAFGSMCCEGIMYDWSAVYFKDYLHVDDAYIRAGYTACMLSMACCRFLADGAANRFGAVSVMRASGILACCGFLIMVIFPNLVAATLGAALVGLGVSSVVPICFGAVSRHKGVVAGRAINAVSTIGFTGFVVGPPVVGCVAEWIGLQWVFVGVAVMAAAIGLLAAKVK